MEDIILRAFETTPQVVLALVIFYFYRQDRMDGIEACNRLAERFDSLGTDFKEIVKENTKAISVLAILIEKSFNKL